MIDKPDNIERRSHMLARIVAHWGASQRPALAGVMWMVVLLGILVWLDDQHKAIFLVPPFAATMSILLYLPSVSLAQPFAVVVGSVLGAAIGYSVCFSVSVLASR
jgi:CBS-domain-containing membrane protein